MRARKTRQELLPTRSALVHRVTLQVIDAGGYRGARQATLALYLDVRVFQFLYRHIGGLV